MKELEKSSKYRNFRDSKKAILPEEKSYSAPSNKQDMRHIKIMSGFRPNSEMPGNDR